MMKRASDEAAVFHVAIGEIRAIMATIGAEDRHLAGTRPHDDHMPVEEFRPVKGAGRHLVGHGDRIPAGIETPRSEEHTSELQSLMRISYAVFCLQKKTN